MPDLKQSGKKREIEKVQWGQTIEIFFLKLLLLVSLLESTIQKLMGTK